MRKLYKSKYIFLYLYCIALYILYIILVVQSLTESANAHDLTHISLGKTANTQQKRMTASVDGLNGVSYQ